MPYTRLSLIAICLTLLLGACEAWGPDRNLRYAADVAEARQAIADGAQVNGTDPVGQTPLIIQARQGHLAVVKFLIDHGAKLDMVDGTGGSALSEAYRAGNKAVVDLLLDSGAYPTIMVNDQEAPLSTP
ncbi:MAG TPA: ankyrin repeat domain-containing protein, partial [Stellaceae bacterium]|nr:ankyrin repeat domain-containing protein [Stellaceae bacterium]